jgi:hypothetical protein
MNKAELITKVSEKANVTQKVAKVIVHPFRRDEGKSGEGRTNRGQRIWKLCGEKLRGLQGTKPKDRGDRGCPSEETSFL